MSPEEALQAEHERRLRRIATAHPAARTGLAAELVLAADQFIIKPVGRNIDAVREGTGPRQGFGRSKFATRFDKAIGVGNTARNWNTVLKLLQLAEAIAD